MPLRSFPGPVVVCDQTAARGEPEYEALVAEAVAAAKKVRVGAAVRHWRLGLWQLPRRCRQRQGGSGSYLFR